MVQENDKASALADEMKTRLMEGMRKVGTDRQLTRELCKQQVTELGDALQLTPDDRTSLASAIEKDENVAITLIDRYLENYLR
jgi:hypothetical protein